VTRTGLILPHVQTLYTCPVVKKACHHNKGVKDVVRGSAVVKFPWEELFWELDNIEDCSNDVEGSSDRPGPMVKVGDKLHNVFLGQELQVDDREGRGEPNDDKEGSSEGDEARLVKGWDQQHHEAGKTH